MNGGVYMTVPCEKEALAVLESKSNEFDDNAQKVVSSVINTTRQRNKNGDNPLLNNFVSALAEAVEDYSKFGTFLEECQTLKDEISNAITKVGTAQGIHITAGILLSIARSSYAKFLLTPNELARDNYGDGGLLETSLHRIQQSGCHIVTDRRAFNENSSIFILHPGLGRGNIEALRILTQKSSGTARQYINCTHEHGCTNQVEAKSGGKHCKQHVPEKCQASADVIKFRVKKPNTRYKPGKDGKCKNKAARIKRNMCGSCYDAENEMNESSSDDE